MSEQIGWRGLVKSIEHEAPYWASTLPQLPRLVHRALSEDRTGRLAEALEKLAAQGVRRNRLLAALVVVAALVLALQAIAVL